ncbi:MAG TPA: histidine phosphatase family protein [Xanthobacteraceae bacterium]|nr:histidine phosphatase family protein [Xanthobacteraceae bacterium]
MRRPVLYYIRHGETDWNAEHRLQGQADTPLNAAGERQAQRCGKILQKLFKLHERDPADLDYVSSPLSRARVTMELIRTALGLDPAGYRIDPRLIEMSFGEWDGLDFAALQTQQAAALALRQQDPWRFVPPGGESYEQLLPRIRDWHVEVKRDTVVSAHLCTARALLVHLGLEPRATASRGHIEHAVVYVFDHNGMTRHGAG